MAFPTWPLLLTLFWWVKYSSPLLGIICQNFFCCAKACKVQQALRLSAETEQGRNSHQQVLVGSAKIGKDGESSPFFGGFFPFLQAKCIRLNEEVVQWLEFPPSLQRARAHCIRITRIYYRPPPLVDFALYFSALYSALQCIEENSVSE